MQASTIINNIKQSEGSIPDIIKKQKEFFASGATRPVKFRIKQLKTLKQAFEQWEDKIANALYLDLKKSKTEAYGTEIGITIADIRYNLKHIKEWTRWQSVPTPLFFIPGKSALRYEPFGVALIISPWNYPIKNLFAPLIGCISAGNCAILKPSEIAPATSKVIKELVAHYFDPEYLTVIEGGVPETTTLLENRFDKIFFTGGSEIGKIIYTAAAKHLTPCTLELGGKSPVIVDEHINLKTTAKRICWGKFVNSGQACVAPDYIFVHKNIKDKLLKELKQTIINFYGDDPSKSDSLGRIISDRHFKRIKKLIQGDIYHGGETKEEQKYIAPTILNNVTPEHPVMQEEIFGPLLPIVEYTDVNEVIEYINSKEKPLALYIFSKKKAFQNKILDNTSSGGVCINETIMHMVSPELPFGGVGYSGSGSYNGFYGFETFSHRKPVMKKIFAFDVKQKYVPYTKAKDKFVRFALRWLV